jgi:hypothetical protein
MKPVIAIIYLVGLAVAAPVVDKRWGDFVGTGGENTKPYSNEKRWGDIVDTIDQNTKPYSNEKRWGDFVGDDDKSTKVVNQ